MKFHRWISLFAVGAIILAPFIFIHIEFANANPGPAGPGAALVNPHAVLNHNQATLANGVNNPGAALVNPHAVLNPNQATLANGVSKQIEQQHQEQVQAAAVQQQHDQQAAAIQQQHDQQVAATAAAESSRQRKAALIMTSLELVAVLVIILIGTWLFLNWSRRQKKFEINKVVSPAGVGGATRDGTVHQSVNKTSAKASPGSAFDDPLLTKAREFYNDKRYADAEQLLRELLLKDKKNAEAHYYLGRVFMTKNERIEAVNRLEAATLIDPGHANAYYHLGELLGQVRASRSAALECYFKVLSLKPEHHLARLRIEELGGVLPSHVPTSEGDRKLSRDDAVKDDAPFLNDVYDTIREDARSNSPTSETSFFVVRQVIESKVAPRRPILTAYLQDFVMHVFVVVGFVIAASVLSNFAAETMNSITSAAGVLAKNNLANARNRYEFAAMACGSAAGLYFIYFLLVVISKKNMRISIDRTIIRIEGGSVFENISEIMISYFCKKFRWSRTS